MCDMLNNTLFNIESFLSTEYLDLSNLEVSVELEIQLPKNLLSKINSTVAVP